MKSTNCLLHSAIIKGTDRKEKGRGGGKKFPTCPLLSDMGRLEFKWQIHLWTKMTVENVQAPPHPLPRDLRWTDI